MSEYKGFVFDIDMTAVPNGAQTVESEHLKAAFAGLPEDTIAIAATGRTPEVALPITQALNLQHESVVANGALIVDSQTGEVSWQRILSQKQVDLVIKSCLPYDFQLYLGGDGLDSYRTAKEQQPRAVASAYLKAVPDELAHSIRDQLVSIDDVDAYLSPAWGGVKGAFDLNIGHTEAKKHNALLELYSRYGIEPSEMIGVGDGINDVELFSVVGHKVAVANADPRLMALADEVVASQEDDGLAEVVARFH
jgi:HAD superfamily hydrolase (TIGR01484 family)